MQTENQSFNGPPRARALYDSFAKMNDLTMSIVEEYDSTLAMEAHCLVLGVMTADQSDPEKAIDLFLSTLEKAIEARHIMAGRQES